MAPTFENMAKNREMDASAGSVPDTASQQKEYQRVSLLEKTKVRLRRYPAQCVS